MSTEQTEMLISPPDGKLAAELKLIGRYYNLQSILNEWMASHGYYIVPHHLWTVVYQDALGNQESLAKCMIYEAAVQFVIERIAPINSTNPVASSDVT